jgi:hypothetical protein
MPSRAQGRPHPPPQIAKLVKDGVQCHPGSVTWLSDNVEWIRLLPSEMPNNYHAGDSMRFDADSPPGQMGKYTQADIDKSAEQNQANDSDVPPFVPLIKDLRRDRIRVSVVFSVWFRSRAGPLVVLPSREVRSAWKDESF